MAEARALPPGVPQIVIVGGGFSGAVTAVQLSRSLPGPARVTVIERRPLLGAGVAYSAADPAHRINVPSIRMTVLPEEPGAFDAWMRARGTLDTDPALVWTDGAAFPQRAVFGEYVATLVAQAARARPEVAIVHRHAGAVAIEARAAGFRVGLEDGTSLPADIVVLAMSHPPASPPRALAPLLAMGGPILADAWAPGALDGIAAEADVLIVGTGLSMADVAASLERRGHRGRVTALSRRGMMSRGHVFGEVAKFEGFATAPPPRSALALCRAIRDRIEERAARGEPWQPVIDDVRSNGRRLWSALDEREQRRIVRHLRPYWDVHRFRVSPQAEAAIARMRADGRFTSRAASLLGVAWDGGRVQVRVRPRGAPAGVEDRLDCDLVVVTTGPDHAHALSVNPALASLAAQGLVHPDRVGLGLAVDERSHAIGADGKARPDLLVVGPLARGRFGELMGLPQVSEHARDVACAVVAALRSMDQHAIQAAAE